VTFLDRALPLAERGFRVFPLIAKKKQPPKFSWGDHFDAATTDRAALELWDKEDPSFNVGISPDEYFCFLETDSETELKDNTKDLPPEIWDTTRVTSGRPDRAYYIYRQTMRTRKVGNLTATREDKDNLFEFKQHRMLVTGPGSIHPITGGEYTADWRSIPAMPDILLDRLCELKGTAKATAPQAMSEGVIESTLKLEAFLAYYEVPVIGEWFNKGKSWLLPVECPWLDQHENQNQGTSTCVLFTEGSGYGFDCKHRCAGKGWKEFRAELERRFPDKEKFYFNPDTSPTVTIGEPTSDELWEGVDLEATTPTAPVEWRKRYHTFEEMRDAPEPTFLIEGFLQRDSITAIAAPVGQRKTIIAANTVRAILTGDPLFDYFKVAERPTRVLYLCPEMGLLSFSKRMKNLGLMEYVGKNLFCRTMNSEGDLQLKDLTDEELSGALVVIDTAVRFVVGDENSSEDMKLFAKDCFRLMKAGAASVLVLFHSPKGTKEASELTLENAMRGSGDLGAFVSSCWATRMQDPDKEWESPSYLRNVKQRDFESKPFEVTSDRQGRLHIVDTPGPEVRLSSKATGPKGNSDGREEEALQVIIDNPTLSQQKIVAKLKEMGIKRSASWVGNKRFELLNTGCKSSVN
jgi:hypothetical protein